MDQIQRIMDDIMPPKAREQYWNNGSQYAKKNPLVFSFLTVQAVFSAIPIAVFLFVSISTLVLTISTALLTSIVVISGAALATLPVLVLTISTASITWSIMLASYLSFNYVFNNFYVDSSVQRDVATIRHNASQLKSEIDQNGSQEFNAYINAAGKVKDDAAAKVDEGYERVKESTYNATKAAKHGVEKGADKAAYVANGIGNGADGLAKDLWKDDGLVDGLKAKKNRVQDGLNPTNDQNYVSENYAVKSY